MRNFYYNQAHQAKQAPLWLLVAATQLVMMVAYVLMVLFVVIFDNA